MLKYRNTNLLKFLQFKTSRIVRANNSRFFISIRSNKPITTILCSKQQKRYHFTSNDNPQIQHNLSLQTFGTTKEHSIEETFYRRKLPSPPAIAFSSKEGRSLFREALELGYMEGYFNLAEQYRTQDEPAYCGLTTLTMVLNALYIDPKRVWKGPWRWYTESMLDGCAPLDHIKSHGITFEQLACLGRCNGLNIQSKRPDKRLEYNAETQECISTPQISNVDNENTTNTLSHNGESHNCHTHDSHHKSNDSSSIHQHHPLPNQIYYSIEQFRNDIKLACSAPFSPVIVAAYSRQFLQQTGEGHYSPIGGYHPTKDMVLIMDVARFKYPPHWMPLSLLYDAMCCVDPSIKHTRGWMVIKHAETLQPYYFTWDHPI